MGLAAILSSDAVRCTLDTVDDSVISRAEVTALLFNVSDIVQSLARVEKLLGGDDDGEKAGETDEG